MAVSKRLRFEIFRRDNHTCRYCGRTAPQWPMQVDHVTPTALGGSDEPTNLVTACVDCNAGKTSVPPGAPLVDDVSADALRWSKAMQHVAQIRLAEMRDREETLAWFAGLWADWNYGGKTNPKPIPAPEGFEGIFKFLAAGLTREEIQHLLNVAMRATHIPPQATWKYFCGCCWKRIRDNADMAAAILTAEGDD